jgi:aldose 1-epimerase
MRDVAGTPLDFRSSKTIGQDLMASYDLLMRAGGYDHTFVLNKSADGRLSHAATAYEPTSGRTLEIFSTEPGMQLYSGNGFAAQAPRDQGKGGVLYALHAGFALEPMHYPDSPNQPSFPSTVLASGESYSGSIVLRFATR